MSVTKETWRGPFVAVYPDGRKIAMERDAIRVTDVRDTILGPIDFGHVQLLPWRYVEIEGPRPVVGPLERSRNWLSRLLRR